MDKSPLITLDNVSRQFSAGEQTVTVLHNISLQINPGEIVAIIGPSGSGKSTLMNILGCLDRPSSGEIQIVGVNTGEADSDQRAALRSQHIGFIFQRYHLMPYLNAMENVMVPARYTAMQPEEQRTRAQHLLTQLGLAERFFYKPTQLSGGQQQRVSIARALMNGAKIILADEPTGALDGQSGKALMAVLHGLHQVGHTIIIVTHDRNIANQAQRIIELNDGHLIADKPNLADESSNSPVKLPEASGVRRALLWRNFSDATRMAWQSLKGHRARAVLSMLGIIIGVASVMISMAVGEGVKQKIIHDISELGSKTLSVRSGLGWDNPRPDFAESLTLVDAELLSQQPYATRVTPIFTQSIAAVIKGNAMFFDLSGVNENYIAIHGMKILSGREFNQRDIEAREPVVIIDSGTAKTLFPGNKNPAGEIIQLSGAPFVVIGVAEPKGIKFAGGGLKAWVPYTSLRERLTGRLAIDSIELQAKNGVTLPEAQRKTEQMLSEAHGRRDFFTYTDDMMLEAVQKTSDSMTLLIAAIATISLVVGGVGVMNIMLVSVTERTHEIGIRLAVGARETDIMQQFLVESVVICLTGCAIGILLAGSLGSLFSALNDEYKLIFSWAPVLFSTGFSALIGIGFGFFPARNAARLNPTEALARE